MVSSGQEAPSNPIDLYRAMARALKYNLEYRVAEVETNLYNTKLNLSHYSMLPDIAANAGYAARDNVQASSSLNVLTNTQNFGASTSQDKRIRTKDLAFSWNILDFGLSYVRSRQAADKYLISQEMKRKVIHKLLGDVRSAYWRTISYDHLIKRLKNISSRTRRAQANSRALSDSGKTARIAALTSERELLDIKRAIRNLQRDLYTAKAELAALMNIGPNTAFKLIETRRRRLPATLPMSLDGMMIAALRDRAELRENLYQQRINMREAKAVLLEMLPGLQLYAGPNWNSNSFLLNNNWISWGATASWNLLKVFQYPAKRRVIQSQSEVLKTRALALTMAVITQVHLSRIHYQYSRRDFSVAREYRSVQRRLVRQYRREAQAFRISEQELLREEINTLIAETKFDIAYSGVQSSFATLFSTIGRDPYEEANPDLPIDEIAAQLRNGWFETGKYTPVNALSGKN